MRKFTDVEIAKAFIGKYYNKADCGIYNCRNIVGDVMYNLYTSETLQIDYCPYYSYFEVFGLSDEDFASLKYFYRIVGELNG